MDMTDPLTVLTKYYSQMFMSKQMLKVDIILKKKKQIKKTWCHTVII
jgi:hypothetical protein